MHQDQLHITADGVTALLQDQFPHWSQLPVRPLSTQGTVNAIFRLGDEFTARFPLQNGDPATTRKLLRAEAAASREFLAASPVPGPEVLAIGEPGQGYPLPWSIQTWLAGHDATSEDPASSADFARDLAALIAQLRTVDTRGRRFAGNGRGGELPDHDDWMERCFEESEDILDVPRLRELWRHYRSLPHFDADVMCHGDLIPPNLLIADRRLSAVLDNGGFGPADPALDLVAAWHVLEDGPRQLLREALGCSEVQWRRGMAWAFQQSMGLVWYYAASNPGMSSWGSRTLDRLLRAERS